MATVHKQQTLPSSPRIAIFPSMKYANTILDDKRTLHKSSVDMQKSKLAKLGQLDENAVIEQFCVTIRAYYPAAKFVKVETGQNTITSASVLVRARFTFNGAEVTKGQYATLMKTGLCHSLMSIWPMKWPEFFEVELDPSCGLVTVYPIVPGYIDWPIVYATMDGSYGLSAERLVKLIHESGMYVIELN